MDEQKVYLGDGAYAEFDGFGIKLTTSNGIRTTSEVYLEPEVFAALLQFAAKFYNLKLPKMKNGT